MPSILILWDGVLHRVPSTCGTVSYIHRVLSILILLDGALHTGQVSLVGSCDHNVSQDSASIAEFESIAISGVKEITNSAAAVSSDRLVESGTSTKSTEGTATPPPVVAKDNDIGSEDAPSIITDESLISKPHTHDPMFLYKMQCRPFDSGYVLYACM